MLRLLTRLVLLFALGFFAPGEAAARVATRAESPDVSAEKLASWGSAPEIAVLRQAAAMQAAEMQQGSASHSYEVASIYSLAAESRLAGAGEIVWPPNRGFVAGEGGQATVLPGQTLDRFGGTGGSFLAPEGTPIPARSLAPGTELRPPNSYEVLQPFEAGAGRAAPWFGQPGGGLQFDLGKMTVQDLIDAGVLRPKGPP